MASLGAPVINTSNEFNMSGMFTFKSPIPEYLDFSMLHNILPTCSNTTQIIYDYAMLDARFFLHEDESKHVTPAIIAMVRSLKAPVYGVWVGVHGTRDVRHVCVRLFDGRVFGFRCHCDDVTQFVRTNHFTSELFRAWGAGASIPNLRGVSERVREGNRQYIGRHFRYRDDPLALPA